MTGNFKKDYTLGELKRNVRVTEEYIEETWKYVNELEGNLQEIQAMLKKSVEYWRESTMSCAEYYIDAYSSAQLNVEAILSSKQKVTQNGK